MIKPIIRDVIFLGRKAEPAEKSDVPVADDLADTLKANAERCVGLAANMIGSKKNIIVFFDGNSAEEMFNPEIVSAVGAYEAEEGCLSLDGTRAVKRYKTIKVRWQNREFKTRIKTFTGFTAQIIQHEIDHCHGIII